MKSKILLENTISQLDQVSILYSKGSLIEAEQKLYHILTLNEIDPKLQEIKPFSYGLSNSIASTFTTLGIIASINAERQNEAIEFYSKAIDYYQQSLSSLKKYQVTAKKEIEFDISGIAYNISVIYQNLKIAEKENDNEYDREKVKEYTQKEREYLISASFRKDVAEDLSDAMRHRLATIYYNLGKNYESDNDLEKDLNASLNRAKEYYKLSLEFANSVSRSYVPAADVFTIEETKIDIRKALKGISNLLNDLSSEDSAEEVEYQSTSQNRKLTKKADKRSSPKSVSLRSVVAPNNDIPSGIARITEFAQTFESASTELWPHQQECLLNIANQLNIGEKYGYVNMATGTGKTKVFTNLVAKMGMETIILAPTTILVEQAANEIRRIAPHLDVGTIDASYKRKGSNVTVMTYASFDKMHQLDAFKNVKLIILDEAHSSLSEKRVNAIRAFQSGFSTGSLVTDSSAAASATEINMDIVTTPFGSSYPVIIGFTATDEFSGKRKAGDFSKVDELLPNRFFKYSIEQGIDDKVLHPCKIVELELDDRINQDFRQILKKRQKNKTQTGNVNNEVEISAADLELLKIDEINRVLVDFICNIQDFESDKTFKNKKGLIFAIDIDHSKAIEEELNKVLGAGYAASIHSKMSKNEQAEVLKKHKAGEIKLLVNVDMLTVGYDDKSLEYIIDFRPTKSTVRLIQTFGRITRKNPEDMEAKTYVQLIIPGVNLEVSELMSGKKVLGEIIVPSGLARETIEETPLETFCYYKVQFPNGRPPIERAVEKKNSIALNQKRGAVSVPKKAKNEFDYNDLLADFARGDFWGEGEIGFDDEFMTTSEQDILKSFDLETNPAFNGPIESEAAKADTHKFSARQKVPEVTAKLDESAGAELDDFSVYRKRGAEEISPISSQDGAAVKRLKEEREKRARGSNNEGLIR